MARYYLNGQEVTREEWSKNSAGITPGKPPLIKSDTTFLAGHCNGNQFERQQKIGDLYRREALAAGVDPKGKVYLSSLAAFPGDPQAWVSGRGDVQRVCEERGWSCSGDVNVKAREPISAPHEVPIADDLVDKQTAEVLSTIPDAQHVDVADLREQVKERISPHWSK